MIEDHCAPLWRYVRRKVIYRFLDPLNNSPKYRTLPVFSLLLHFFVVFMVVLHVQFGYEEPAKL